MVDYTEDCGTCYDTLNTTGAHSSSYTPCQCILNFKLNEDFQVCEAPTLHIGSRRVNLLPLSGGKILVAPASIPIKKKC